MIPRFDPDGPLPEGLVVVEAGAGTGKTHHLAGLVARYVAEGHCTLPELLVVTFTRLATSELRDRVRRRLAIEAGRFPPGDPRADRLRAAAAEVDAATITTIHAFAERALRLLGLVADRDPAATLEQDVSEVVAEVLDDMSARALTARGRADDAVPSRRVLDEIADVVLANPEAAIVPDPEGLDGPARQRVRAARLVAARVPERLRARQAVSYDGLIRALAASLRSESAVAELRRRYRVALVDEFQDTDTVQWELFRRVFDGHGTLVLIGDPKQSIYAFRGADVAAYLDAVRAADGRQVLDECWRSDGRLVDGLNALFRDVTFGDDAIAYHRLSCTPAHRADRLAHDPPAPPVGVRVLLPAAWGAGGKETVGIPAARELVARDVAARTVGLLDGGSTFVADGRRLAPHDLAVLVRTHAEAQLVHAALRAADVPAVVNGVGSVLATDAAVAWQRLLDALERPDSAGRAAAAALGPLVGWRAEQLAAAGERELDGLHEQLVRWSGVLREHGVAALARTVVVEQGVGPRLLAREGGERLLADLEHLAELLHAAARAERLGPAALAAWLRRERRSASRSPDDDRSRRLESDAEAVQVMTVHRAKGLEFPVVLCPFLFQPPWSRDEVAVLGRDGRRVVDVSGRVPPGWAEERAAEDLRVTYVALTRARHRLLLWWAPSHDAAGSALTGLLQPRGQDAVPRWAPAGVRVLAGLAELGARSGGAVAGEQVDAVAAPVRWRGPDLPRPGTLGVARFGRGIDTTWRRTSYTALRAVGEEARAAEGRAGEGPALVGSEPEGGGVLEDEVLDGPARADAGAAAASAGAAAASAGEAPVPLDALPGGSDVGTLVHRVLEAVDFPATAVEDVLTAAVEEQAGRSGLNLPDVPAVAAGLRRVLETPLGPLVDDLRLADVPRADRRDELAFELPLAGGDAPTGSVGAAAIADLLAAHLPPGDPLAAYPARLRQLDRPVRGYLTGSVDLVLRHRGRFLVVDYKTNVLRRVVAGQPQPLTALDYRPAALAGAMVAGDYPLQALLYAVVLHRFLRWRVPGYAPDLHLGGVLYLFVRGMTGADVPRVDGAPCGVFAWRPPTALVRDLSDLLAEGAEPAPR